jgi:hypothetical protein
MAAGDTPVIEIQAESCTPRPSRGAKLASLARKLARFSRKPLPEKWATIYANRYVLAVVWRVARDWLNAFALAARLFATGSGLPKHLLFHGLTPGDDLMCTAVLRELRRRRSERLAMISNYPDLFSGNEDVACVLPAGDSYSTDRPPLSVYRRFARICGSKFTVLFYARVDGQDRHLPPSCHCIAATCVSADVTGPVSIKPYFALTAEEKTRFAWAAGRIVIQSSGLGGRFPMQNKQWYPERFQGVVDALREQWEFIQLGSAQDPQLRHAKDLRGATDMRESAAVLCHARLYIGNVGFLMHLARAVDCPSVIVYGGREAPWQSGYICNLNLYLPVPCAPCWRNNLCDLDRKCMRDISVADVVSAVQQMTSRPRGPLAVEKAEIAPPKHPVEEFCKEIHEPPMVFGDKSGTAMIRKCIVGSSEPIAERPA